MSHFRARWKRTVCAAWLAGQASHTEGLALGGAKLLMAQRLATTCGAPIRVRALSGVVPSQRRVKAKRSAAVPTATWPEKYTCQAQWS